MYNFCFRLIRVWELKKTSKQTVVFNSLIKHLLSSSIFPFNQFLLFFWPTIELKILVCKLSLRYTHETLVLVWFKLEREENSYASPRFSTLTQLPAFWSARGGTVENSHESTLLSTLVLVFIQQKVSHCSNVCLINCDINSTYVCSTEASNYIACFCTLARWKTRTVPFWFLLSLLGIPKKCKLVHSVCDNIWVKVWSLRINCLGWYVWTTRHISLVFPPNIYKFCKLCNSFSYFTTLRKISFLLRSIMKIFHSIPELQKSCGYAGITREKGLPYVRSVRKV